MKNLKAILVLISLPIFLMGCTHNIAQQQDSQKTAFKQALEENTLQCRKSIEMSKLSNTRSKIFWASRLSEPTTAMQSDENFVQEKEKSEIEKLHQLVECCQNMYSKTITSFISTEHGERFKDHLNSKQSNLNDLNNGMISYGTYNRKEVELRQQLMKDLQFLDEKYHPQVRRQSASAPIPSFPLKPFSLGKSAFLMQLLFVELLSSLPMLIL